MCSVFGVVFEVLFQMPVLTARFFSILTMLFFEPFCVVQKEADFRNVLCLRLPVFRSQPIAGRGSSQLFGAGFTTVGQGESERLGTVSSFHAWPRRRFSGTRGSLEKNV